MKKIIIFIILLGLLITGIFTFKKDNKDLKKIKVGDATITSKHHLTH